MKLLNIVKAQNAYFGEKDYQQYELVKGMKEAFFIDTEIVPCPTERDENGIALSSRNRRLTKEQMNVVKNFPLLLSSKHLSPNEITEKLKALGFKVNYIEDTNNRRYGSVQIGDINLIDNFNLS
ncbi:unnamed protein product [Acanthoscelides obtectus]|nr:unnamed protein product [Acanthoscelides obtectus]CAK1674597.1 Pantothenate synthetase [Acanthoscelides obtectus]